ncbi:MAG: glycosyltransferase [Gemmatimonadetes bacterium]|nr:glycosyltransferase [Gemmatimonadota bacterium]
MHVLALIALVIAIVALVNTVLNLLLVRRLPASGLTEGPLVSVIIPARNEERAIEQTVRAFLAQRYRVLELVVVNDRSTDATGAILDRIAAEDPRLAVIHGEPPPEGWLGKPWALHEGSRHARGELFFFVDGDIIYSPEAVGTTVSELQRSDRAMVALLPYVEMQGFWEHVAMPMLAVTFFTMLPSWIGNRTRSVRLALGGGAGMLVRRSAYQSAGGHEALKSAVVDDIGLARLIRRHGGRTVALRADHLIRMRMYHGAAEIVYGFTKNMFSAMGRNYLIVLFWFLFGLVANFLPYGLALAGDPIGITTVILLTMSRVILFAALGYRLDNAILAHPLMTAFWGGVMLRSTWITGFRGLVHWRGRTYGPTVTR